jgi:3-oxoacyl-[acyl-carrier-protein] synthase-1
MKLTIIGSGATSPCGLDARQSALFARAAKLAPRAYDLGGDSRRRVGTARVRRIADDVIGTERLLRLAIPALREARATAGLDPETPIPAFVSLPEARVWGDKEERRIAGTWLDELAHKSEVKIDLARSETIRIGHAGFALALEHALARGEPALVGGVDSYHHPDVLADLEQNFRLLSESAHAGLVPSEAAAFLVVAPKPNGRTPPRGTVLAAAAGNELPKTWEEPRIAELLTDLVVKVSASLQSRPLRWVLTDVNGERQRSKERDYLCFRVRELIDVTGTQETRLARETGDCGAATGAFAASFVVQGFVTGFAESNEALVMTSSHGDARGVFALGQAEGAG